MAARPVLGPRGPNFDLNRTVQPRVKPRGSAGVLGHWLRLGVEAWAKCPRAGPQIASLFTLGLGHLSRVQTRASAGTASIGGAAGRGRLRPPKDFFSEADFAPEKAGFLSSFVPVTRQPVVPIPADSLASVQMAQLGAAHGPGRRGAGRGTHSTLPAINFASRPSR